MSNKEKLEEAQRLITEAIKEEAKFTVGNNAAGTRLRGGLQKVKALAQEVRISVQEDKNSKA